MKQMTFLDLCSGIGGFRLGLETAGHKCIGYCEYDKFARASYEAMYDTEGEWKAHDVTKLKPEDVPYADIWCFGFPCQDISVAGKQRGLVGKRSGIYYNIIDLLKGKEESAKPSYLLVENVKNLLSINAGFDFASVLSEMDEAGYDCRWQVLNSKNFGVPQNRERVFIIANLRSRGRREILPLTGENAAALNQLIGGMQGYRVYGTDGINLAYPDSETRRGRVGKGCSQTLDCSGQMGTLMRGGRIRRLTPRECFRLQGFSDELFDRASAVNSDAQLYKQAGNAVTATVAYAVAMSLPESRS